jgi:hypothetical protein
VLSANYDRSNKIYLYSILEKGDGMLNRIRKSIYKCMIFLLVLFSISCMNKPIEPITIPASPDNKDALTLQVSEGKDYSDSEEATQLEAASSLPEADQIDKNSSKSSNTSTTVITPGTSAEEIPNLQATVTISIRGDEQKGTILEPTDIEWHDEDSVLDALIQVTKNHRIPLEYRGRGILSYVEGIGNLYEFDKGPGSGWLFKVNGEFADKSAGAVKLDKGDKVEWIYIIDPSEDPDR